MPCICYTGGIRKRQIGKICPILENNNAWRALEIRSVVVALFLAIFNSLEIRNEKDSEVFKYEWIILRLCLIIKHIINNYGYF